MTGQFVKIQLYFTSRWLMVSEVFFISSSIGNSTQIQNAGNPNGGPKEVDPESDEHPVDDKEDEDPFQDSTGYMHDGAELGDTHINLVKEIQDDNSHQKHVALVIGVLVAVILLLMAAILFIFWRTKRQKTGGLTHDLLPGPFGEKRDIVSIKVGVDVGDSLSKNGLYAEPFHVTYGSTYSTGQRLQRTLPGSSPDYTECGSTEYAIPHLLGSSDSSPYHNLLPHVQQSSHPHLSSFMNPNTATPPPMSPHQSLAGDKSSERGFLSLGSRAPTQEYFYATTEIVKGNNGETVSSLKSDAASYVDGESIGSSLGASYPPEIPRQKIKFLQQIGEGQFGEVHLGTIEEEDGKTKLTAVKTLRLEASPAVRRSFEREVDILGRLRNVNIVGVVGICSQDEPLCMLVEYCEHGDLNQFLQCRVAETASPRATKAETISYGTLIYMATQIASGMKYLEGLNFVHRDLATRNCLVGGGHLIKICDFGMSRAVYSGDYYRAEGKILIPIRWMAWEPLLLGKFTTKSDVWAFAVTMWEILTMAREKPFEELSDEQVIENVSFIYHNDTRKVTLSIPPSCPKEIYDLMRECWKRSDVDRPSFKEIHMFLQRKNLGYAPNL